MKMHKDVEVGGQRYKIGRLPAKDGSWIIVMLQAKMRAQRALSVQVEQPELGGPSPESEEQVRTKAQDLTMEEGMLMTATFLIAQLDRESLEQIMYMCLAYVKHYEEVAGQLCEMPVMVGGDRWAIAELEYDGPSVLELTKQSLAFNIAPFMTAGG